MSRPWLNKLRQSVTPERYRSDRPLPTHDTPDRIVLAPRSGQPRPGRPPVRLFLGSERARFQEERLFVWSVEKFRHPDRVYEVYLLRDLSGFGRHDGPREFHAYRYAVPEFANFAGRALYLDVGRVFRADPARWFDQAMNGAGVLSMAHRDPSVMLLDCERMGELWNRQTAIAGGEGALLDRAESEVDWELLNGNGVVGAPSRRLERHADRVGFLPFTAMRPSRDWVRLRLYLSSRPDGARLQELLAPRAPDCYLDHRRVGGWLERVPDPDVPWVLARLLHLTGELELDVREPLRAGGGRLRRDATFWVERLELAGRLEPKRRWRLTHSAGPGRTRVHKSGG